MKIGQKSIAAVLAAGAVVAAFAAPAAADPAKAFFTGSVTGDGKPLRGVSVAAVTVVLADDVPSLEVLASTTTRADGSYRLGVPAFSDLTLVQFGAGAATGGTSPTGYADRCFDGPASCVNGGRTYHLVAGRTYAHTSAALGRAAELRGRVTDTLGRGVGGFPVELYHGSGAGRGPDGPVPYATTVTDVNGNYVVARQPADTDTDLCFGSAFNDPAVGGTPAHDGYSGWCEDALVTLRAGGITRHDVVAQGRGGVRGRVVDTSGAPVAGATVDVTDPGGPGPFLTGVRTADTLTDGTFRVAAVDSGRATYCVSAPRFASTCSADPQPTITVRPFGTSSVGTIVLQRQS